VIRRTFDARFLNAVANHEEVRPWIGGQGLLDLAPVIANSANVALVTDHGGWVLAKSEPGIYELHTLFLKAGRGRAYFDHAAEAMRYMFARTDAREIVTRIPASNRGAAFAAARVGFRERFSRKDAFRAAGGALVDVSYQALTIDDWWPTDPEALAAGEVFHAQIETAKVRFDSALPDHPEDLTHDRAAGAACLMIAAGNARKGVWFYNRWAALAGYAPINLLTETPLVIDTGAGVVVEVHAGIMEVLSCP
jgi:RimJ/RimL family protein N-acetyltransferase